MNEILKKFGKRVKELRKTHKYTQGDLARLSGLHPNYIGMIERGERNPSLLNIEIIANSFGVSISELMKL
jgi:transcriptional regulator with XRE-family HTH domain